MNLSTIFVWVMAVFYILSGVVPLLSLEKTSAQYKGWGYPTWFPFVTAVFEVAIGLLFLWSQTRMAGVALGVLVMLAAIGTVLRAKEYAHAIPPTIVLILTVLVGRIV